MSIIEHVVLFNVRGDATKSEINSMVERANSLISLEETLHLTMGPLLRIQSSSSSINFTHILYSRFSSKDQLHAYAVHPSHVAVIKANAHLIIDSMALDWVTETHGDAALVPPPGSALRVTFFKLKEGVGEQVKNDMLKTIRITQHDEHAIQFTCGENFSPGRSKGFSIASLVVFPQLQETIDDDEFAKYHNHEELKEHLENVLVFDYVPLGHS